MKTKNISEVFTPRDAIVNSSMYIPRTQYETDFLRRINGTMHVIVPGDSGIGKSWLYKKVFTENSIKYYIANCGSATEDLKLTDIIINSVYPTNHKIIDESTTHASGEVNFAITKGTVDATDKYGYVNTDKLKMCYEYLKDNHKGKVIIVFDNLEAIYTNSNYMSELSNILLLLDDPSFNNVRYLLVGTPQNILDYFRQTKNLASVANRMTELPRIPVLTEVQVRNFCTIGFCSELNIKLTELELEKICKHVFNVTLGIPQYMHEFCEFLAYKIEDNDWTFNEQMLERANFQWIISSLRHYYVELEKIVNKSEKKIGRRNQVLFCISQIRSYSFDTLVIEAKMKFNFPNTTNNTTINIPTILNGIIQDNSNIIKRINGTNKWEIVDPKYLLVLRMALVKQESEKVMLSHFKLQ